jgi:negative regulator of genetic competence, sporulation and motility
MDIKKLNNNCITCRISKQELDDRGVVLEDLLSDKEKARELLSEVLMQAEQVVDFKADGGSLNVQMTVLSDGDINLTIFDDDRSAFAAMLRQYKELLESKRKELMELVDKTGESSSSGSVDVGNPISALSAEETRKLLNSKSETDPVDLPVEVSFESLDDLMKLSKLLYAWNGDTDSSLYSYNDRYYLQLILTETKLTLVRSIFAISEYSGVIENNVGTAIKVSEHGKCILAEHAVKSLAMLADE